MTHPDTTRLQQAVWRLEDILKNYDPQAWKEARKFLERLKKEQWQKAQPQAETQQPTTNEPAMDVRCEGCGYMTHHREHMGCVRAAKQHTHPAPSAARTTKENK